MTIKPASTVYNILNGIRRLRLISKLNKRYSIYQQIKLPTFITRAHLVGFMV